MLRELAVNTRVIYYLMALLGMIGVLAKAVNKSTKFVIRDYVQEYTPTDKTRKSKIRTCMYGA